MLIILYIYCKQQEGFLSEKICDTASRENNMLVRMVLCLVHCLAKFFLLSSLLKKTA
jgi:hypothetical protein